MLHTLAQGTVDLCRAHPQLVIFLSLALGYWLGKVTFFGFKLGATASVLLVALVLGQMGVTVTPLLKDVAFALFIFTIGYKVGPQFFGGLKKDGIWYTIIALVVAITGLFTALGLGKLLGLDKGTTAGLLGGAMTQSSILGTAEGAIKTLSLSSGQQAALTANMAVSYAITYIFGVAGLILFYKFIPKLLKIDLKKEALKLTTSSEGTPTATEFNRPNKLRAYRVTQKAVVNMPIVHVANLLGDEVVIEAIKRASTIIPATPKTTLQQGDLVALIGTAKALIHAPDIIGPEVEAPELNNQPYATGTIFIMHNIKKTLKQFKAEYSGLLVTKIIHQGQEVPLHDETLIAKNISIQVVGLQSTIDACASTLGYLEKKTSATDLALVGFGCAIGTLIGIASFTIGTIPITLSIGGGVLLAGLILGWLRSVHPTFGFIPTGAQWLLTELGLNLFIACVGLTAGPHALKALQTKGFTLFFAGILVTLVPTIVGLIVGRLVLRLNYVLLLGALTGAGTATPSLNVLKNEADSFAPVLGYTVPYAIGNFVLTIWGTIIIYLM